MQYVHVVCLAVHFQYVYYINTMHVCFTEVANYRGLLVLVVQVLEEEWRYRTEQCTVPPGALENSLSLFTAEVRREGGRRNGEGKRKGREVVSTELREEDGGGKGEE